MFCKKCGKQVKDGAVFCTYCGTKIMPVGQSQSGVEETPGIQPVQYIQPPVSVQMPEKQPNRGNKSLVIPIAIAAVGILIVIGGIFFVLRLNSRTDENFVVEDITKDNEPEQTDTHYDFSPEEVEQNIESDTDETDISRQEEVESEIVEEEISQYVLPNSDSAYLTESDLYGLTQEECRLARNELYARHGRLFDDEGLQSYFNSKDWYYGYISPSDFSDSILNEYEKENRDLIVQFEEEMGYR